MLKAANVSKDQIDSALLSADTSNDDDSDSVEEIMLSSEHEVDPAVRHSFLIRKIAIHNPELMLNRKRTINQRVPS